MECGDVPSLLYSENSKGFWSTIDKDFNNALGLLEDNPIESYKIFSAIENKLEGSIDEEGLLTYESARLYKSIALLIAGKIEEAKRELKSITWFSKIAPIKAKALAILAALEDKREYFEKALKEFPNAKCLNRFLADAYLYIGIGIERKNLGRAITYYKRASELTDDIEIVGKALDKLFRAYLRLGEKEKAYNTLSLLESALAYNSKDKDLAYLYSGAVSILLGEYEEAIRYFERVKKHKGIALLGEALAYRLLGDYEKSRLKLSQAQRMGLDWKDFKKFFSSEERIELRKLLGRQVLTRYRG